MEINSRKIFKNAAALSLRMLLVTIAGVFTFRIVLNALGVVDYGVYTVVAGLIGTVAFLNTSMAGATSRFIAFALGQDDERKAGRVFSAAVVGHSFIAVLIVILAETLGLWFVNVKLNLPEENITAANIIYQLSILSTVMGITQVPYTATIIAHERMAVYAYLEIANVVSKLAIAILILYLPTNRLVVYACLMTIVSVIITSVNRIYCICNFRTAKFRRKIDRNICRDLFAFSGFDLYGNMCESARTQSIPILLNLFFGIIANAAAGIAATVANIFSGFAFSVTQAFRPQIIKHYAVGDYSHLEILMRRAALFSIFIYGLIAVPFFVCASEIIFVWLGEIPQYSVWFIRLMLISLTFSIIIIVTNIGIQATGDIRKSSIICGSVYLLYPLVSYFAIKGGAISIYAVYVINIMILAISGIIGLWILKTLIPQISIYKFMCPIVKYLSLSVPVGLASVCCGTIFAEDGTLDILYRITFSFLICIVLLSVISYLLVFDKQEKNYVKDKLRMLRVRCFA